MAFAISVATAGCHEAPGGPELTAGVAGADLALSCEANLACERGVCDLATLECVDCVTDSDCDDGRCHPRDQVCVQCVGDADCDDGFCHPTRAVCVGCFDDAQCRFDGRGVCHPDKLGCVECTSDRDCGAGVCNLETFACIGQCVSDAQCDDHNPCSEERCSEGNCAYAPVTAPIACDDGVACTARDHCQAGRCKGEPTSACCAPLECKPDARARDSDDDGCNDACVCGPEPACPVGTTPHDQNGGGCNDHCLCASGAIIGPDGECPCAVSVSCDGGLVPSDLDGDGCPDTCAKPCHNACDCDAQGLVTQTPCPLACATCGAFLECVAGACSGRCGVIPERACDCPAAPSCGPRESAFDSDGDGCNDACRCLVDGPNGCACPTLIVCSPGASPIDTDRDGCADTCQCDDPARRPAPDGNCCPAITCPAGQIAVDVEGDVCPDACVCDTGDAPSFALPVCPCKPIACPEGSTPADTDQDGCADACRCADGTRPGPAGCEVCLSDCAGEDLPPWRFFIDGDEDGCFDEAGECPIGSTAASSPGSGCPDFCAPCKRIECPPGARPHDTDADRCPDLCVCDDLHEAPPSGCGCASDLVCAPPEVPIDVDRDGCVDTCRTPCTSACDCDAARPAAPCDCVDCRIGATCIDGFCASSCVANVDACLDPAADAMVCGCDGESYPSRCEASAAGVDVAHGGVCGAGCATDSDCQVGERCESTLASCNTLVAPNDTASCVAIPTSCLPAADPVCGCDGKTYASDCERLRANVGRAARGACLSSPR